MTPPKIVLSYLVGASLALGSLAFAQEATVAIDNHPGSVKTMKRCDQNGDGKLTEEEFVATAKNEAQLAKKIRSFKKIDTDHDGFMTYDELNAQFEKIRK